MTALEILALPNNEFYANNFTTKVYNWETYTYKILTVAGISDHTINLVHDEDLTKMSVKDCTLSFTMTPNK